MQTWDDVYGPGKYARHLRDTTTGQLIADQRLLPCEEVAAELESRGVVLWHYGLRRTV